MTPITEISYIVAGVPRGEAALRRTNARKHRVWPPPIPAINSYIKMWWSPIVSSRMPSIHAG
ncbi:MAG: hypothetical protein H7138_18495 [Myxococcales bacterium]|nr:hypothetical protein [Myxococcales bacterium]